eukprot:82546-Rhodomonas_salina.6
MRTTCGATTGRSRRFRGTDRSWWPHTDNELAEKQHFERLAELKRLKEVPRCPGALFQPGYLGRIGVLASRDLRLTSDRLADVQDPQTGELSARQVAMAVPHLAIQPGTSDTLTLGLPTHFENGTILPHEIRQVQRSPASTQTPDTSSFQFRMGPCGIDLRRAQGWDCRWVD